MATATFSNLEQRVNSAAALRLCNAVASFGGDDIPVIFDDGMALGGVGIGMATSQPTIQLLTTAVPANPDRAPVTVKGASYVVGMHEPDGSGWSRLLLEVAP